MNTPEYPQRRALKPLSPGGLIALVLLLAGWAGSAVAGIEQRTIVEVMASYSDRVAMRLQPRFQFSGVDWPPREVTLVAFKDTRQLELWARSEESWVHIKDYRIRGLSGRPGPKLQEGDRQVPEGRYRISLLNPNSAFHLSLKLNYPNAYDREKALEDGRVDLGGDIFIHGDQVSKGCLAMGDRSVEELFVLAAMIGVEHVSVLITPRDFRFRPPLPPAAEAPDWVDGLHRRIANNLQNFPLELK